MDDPRNHLVWDYVKFLERVQPDGFVFENVTGLLNMQGGKVFAAIKEAFSSVMPSMSAAVLSTDEHGIPQRRKRIILVGRRIKGASAWIPPQPVTSTEHSGLNLFFRIEPAVSVHEALSDLPSLEPGEDGSAKPYRYEAQTIYQALMRGRISPEEYFARLEQGLRTFGSAG
jgi:DNA (cytosine-5)-methyltransferase 1